MKKLLKITNFKGFSGPTEVELAPITLVYGANSAGKSAVLESLLLLSQSIRQAPLGLEGTMDPINFVGQNVDLGSFQALINGHNLSKNLGLGISYENKTHDTPFLESFDIELSWDHKLKRSVLESCVYKVSNNPERTVRFVRDRNNSEQISVVPVHDSGLKEIIESIAEIARRRLNVSEKLIDSISSVLTNSRFYQNWSFLPGIKRPEELKINENLSEDEIKEIVEKDFSHREWRRMLEDRFLSTRKNLASIKYIGPLRKSPTRIESLVEHDQNYVGIEGEGVASILFREPKILTLVNESLTKMEIPYELMVKRIDTEYSGTLGELIALLAVDKRTNVILSLEDVGFGISQILPLLVQLSVNRNQFILVEQPELHLHPALQANVGDLLIDGIYAERESQFLIETHSEHLLLRLQRRIRTGKIKPSDLIVYYVSTSETQGSSLTKLEIDENGDFITPWPNGFFPERIDEILS